MICKITEDSSDKGFISRRFASFCMNGCCECRERAETRMRCSLLMPCRGKLYLFLTGKSCNLLKNVTIRSERCKASFEHSKQKRGMIILVLSEAMCI